MALEEQRLKEIGFEEYRKGIQAVCQAEKNIISEGENERVNQLVRYITKQEFHPSINLLKKIDEIWTEKE